MTRISPGAPEAPPDPETLPHALTFFLTRAERAAVLRALRAHARARGGLVAGKPWRAAALLGALGISNTRSKESRR